MNIIVLFLFLQLLNVILSTIRSVVTIKGTRIAASIVNAVYYGFYTIIVIYTAADNMNIWVKIAITTTTNFIGTYIGRYIVDKIKCDKLWEITATFKQKYKAEIEETLLQNNILYISLATCTTKITALKIYSKNKTESKQIRSILKKYDAYFVAQEFDKNL